MDTGIISTAVLALLITVAVWAGVKRAIRKFANGTCCGSGSCSACGGGCGKEKS